MGWLGLQSSQPTKPRQAKKQGRRPSDAAAAAGAPPLPFEQAVSGVSGEKGCDGALGVSLAAPLKTGGRGRWGKINHQEILLQAYNAAVLASIQPKQDSISLVI
ncbi:MAG: hypothetical protein IPN76_32215 [Saprospiraceae bacterium]|nr:hypothetical protein [Saprospiraceae bacterium]